MFPPGPKPLQIQNSQGVLVEHNVEVQNRKTEGDYPDWAKAKLNRRIAASSTMVGSLAITLPHICYSKTYDSAGYDSRPTDRLLITVLPPFNTLQLPGILVASASTCTATDIP